MSTVGWLRGIFGAARERLSTVRARLTIWYVALLAIILVVFSAFLYISLRSSLYANMRDLLVADSQTAVVERHGALDLSDQVPGFAALYLPDTTVVVTHNKQLTQRARQVLSLDRAPQDNPQTITLPNGSSWLVLTRPIVSDGHVVGALQVGRSLDETEQALHRLQLLMAIAIPLTLLLAVGGGLFLAGRALTPIDRITRAAARINAEDLSRRLRLPRGRDEVGRLAATFDEMIERLDRAFQRQRQFTADASHELRTPLALMKSQTDVVLARDRSKEEYRETLESLRSDIDRMAALVGDMLTLARADSGVERLSREPVALGELVADVATQLQPLAEEHGTTVRWLGNGQGPVVFGDETRLMQLVLNLVENGIKYAPGGEVSVEVSECGRTAQLVVSDNGQGIEPEHLEHLFERYYRADPSRARSDGGTGLGLAICQWIAQAHGGHIEVESAPGSGATFTVTLPLGERTAGRDMA